jgi:GTPase
VNDTNSKDVVVTTNVMSIGGVYPIFQVSSVDKRGLKLFIEFLNILPSNKQWLKNKLDASEFLITQMH